MKKFLLILFAFLLFFTSCKEKIPVKSITIENPKTEFVIGEKFSAGENFVLKAELEDGTEKQISSKKCKFLNGNEIIKGKFKNAGEYNVTVIYAEKLATYSITVTDQGFLKRNKGKITFFAIIGGIVLLICCLCGKKAVSKTSGGRRKKINFAKRTLDECRKISSDLYGVSDKECLLNCGMIADKLITQIAIEENIMSLNEQKANRVTPGELLKKPEFCSFVGDVICGNLSKIKKLRNKVAHEADFKPTGSDRSEVESLTNEVINWFERKYC